MLGKLIEEHKVFTKDVSTIKEYMNNSFDGGVMSATRLTTTLSTLFSKMDSIRNRDIVINNKMNTTFMELGSEKISIKDATLILENITRKLDVLNYCIDNCSPEIDVFDLMRQKDKIAEEFLLISSEINKILWAPE